MEQFNAPVPLRPLLSPLQVLRVALVVEAPRATTAGSFVLLAFFAADSA